MSESNPTFKEHFTQAVRAFGRRLPARQTVYKTLTYTLPAAPIVAGVSSDFIFQGGGVASFVGLVISFLSYNSSTLHPSAFPYSAGRTAVVAALTALATIPTVGVGVLSALEHHEKVLTSGVQQSLAERCWKEGDVFPVVGAKADTVAKIIGITNLRKYDGTNGAGEVERKAQEAREPHFTERHVAFAQIMPSAQEGWKGKELIVPSVPRDGAWRSDKALITRRGQEVQVKCE